MPVPRRRAAGATARSTKAAVGLSRSGSSRRSAPTTAPSTTAARCVPIAVTPRREQLTAEGHVLAARPRTLRRSVGTLAHRPHLAPGPEQGVVRHGLDEVHDAAAHGPSPTGRDHSLSPDLARTAARGKVWFTSVVDRAEPS